MRCCTVGCPESNALYFFFWASNKVRKGEIFDDTNLMLLTFMYKVVKISDRQHYCCGTSQWSRSMMWGQTKCCNRIRCCQERISKKCPKILYNVYGSAAVDRSSISWWARSDIFWDRKCTHSTVLSQLLSPEKLQCADANVSKNWCITISQLALTVSISKEVLVSSFEILDIQIYAGWVSRSLTVQHKTERKHFFQVTGMF